MQRDPYLHRHTLSSNGRRICRSKKYFFQRQEVESIGWVQTCSFFSNPLMRTKKPKSCGKHELGTSHGCLSKLPQYFQTTPSGGKASKHMKPSGNTKTTAGTRHTHVCSCYTTHTHTRSYPIVMKQHVSNSGRLN